MNSRRHLGDAIAVVLLGGLAFTVGRSAFAHAPMPSFYQHAFGPAVMLAAGGDFVQPEIASGSALEAFLANKTDRLDEFSRTDVATVMPPDQFQNAHRYLIGSVGYLWRITGISWTRLAEVAGASHTLAVLSTFALLRLFVPLALAVAGAAWFAISPLQLGFAPHVRDFAKGAFVLAAVPLVVALVLRAPSRRALVLVSALTGAVIGIGIGFKMDVAIMAPIALVCLVLFRGRRPWTGLGDKALAVAVLVITLGVTAWPILSRLSSGGSNAVHVVLLGYSEWFDTRMGVEPGPYSFVSFYSDNYLRNMLRVRAAATTGKDAPMPSTAYDRASVDLWKAWLRHFPADAFTRLIAASNGVLNLAFDNPAPTNGAPPLPLPAAFNGFFNWMYGWRGWGWFLGVAAVLAAGRTGVGHALFAIVLLMTLAGYPSLQYDPRHYFHLQAIPIAIIVALVWAVWSRSVAMFRGGSRLTPVEPVGPRVSLPRSLATAALVVIGVTVVPTVTLRAYQAHHLNQVFAEFLQRDRVPLTVEFVPVAENRWLARWDDVRGLPFLDVRLKSAYYLAEFRADDSSSAMAIGLRYSSIPDWKPCAYPRTLSTAAGVARFAFPVYSLDEESSFEGIEMGTEMRSRLIGIYRMNTGPAGAPIEVRLGSDWQDRKLFQRLVDEERLWPDDANVGLTLADKRCGSELPYLDATLDPRLRVDAGQVDTVHSSVVDVGPTGIHVDGSANPASSFLVQYKPVTMAAGDALVVRLWVDRGGTVIGLLKNGSWHGQVLTPRPGLSVVIVPVAEAGSYVPVVTSAAPGWRRAVRFNIDRLGVVRADGSVLGEAVTPQIPGLKPEHDPVRAGAHR